MSQQEEITEVCKQTKFQSPEKPENMTGKIEQQARKKKKIQAKRPGYARDSKLSRLKIND